MAFYRDLGRRTRGPILELGCGTGRIALPLLKAGRQVTGLDLSRPMLGRFLEKLHHAGRRVTGQSTLLQADMRDLPLRGPYALVLCPFNAFMHLYFDPDVEACLAEIRRVLDRRGRFVFDVMNPDLRYLLRDPDRRWSKTRFKHPQTGEQYIYTTNHVYDAKRQIAHIKIYLDCVDDPGRSQVVSIAHRQFFPRELRALLRHNGFTVTHEYGDFDQSSFEADSDAQILVCRPT